ncbi:MAG: SPOR domain-containing protein [Gammaproteobacteria bacterium]|nr:SPOR domain-containing protein [Gammaproteobacteria bacterium]
MARAYDDGGDFNPKHRIVGAIIVVSLAVIVLPMILSDEPGQPAASRVSDISEIPQLETKVLRLPTTSLAEQAVTDTQVTTTTTTVETGSTKKPEKSNTTITAKATQTQQTEPKRSASETSTAAGGWVVQVGTFSNDDNVRRLRDKLKKHGFLVKLVDVKLKGEKAVRVRVGPYRQKRVAEKAQTQIRQKVGVEGVVLAYK